MLTVLASGPLESAVRLRRRLRGKPGYVLIRCRCTIAERGAPVAGNDGPRVSTSLGLSSMLISLFG
jgi:hypothetical protein